MWPQGPPNTTPCARGGPQGGGPGFADITGVRLRPLPRPRQLRRGAQALPRTVGCGCGSAATPAPGPWKPAGRSSRPCLLSTTSKRAHFKSRAGAEGARMRACRRCEVCGLRGLTPPHPSPRVHSKTSDFCNPTPVLILLQRPGVRTAPGPKEENPLPLHFTASGDF